MQRKQSEMQGLRQLWDKAAACQRRGEVIDWVAIKRAVLRTRPPFAESIDAFAAFIVARSGGPQGRFLQYMQSYYRTFVNPSVRASLPAAIYQALADFPHHYLAIALWEAAYSCHVASGSLSVTSPDSPGTRIPGCFGRRAS